MANKLKIYACSGIGSTPEFNYWTDNTNTMNNTQAVNTMLAKINLAYSEVQYLQLSEQDIINKLNDIDLYTLTLCCADGYKGDPDKLLRCGHVIGKMYAEGDFQNNSFDNAQRDIYLDQLISKAQEIVDGSDNVEASTEFMKWWDENVMQRDKVGLDETTRGKIKKALKKEISGIGAGASYQDNAELSKMLNNGADYFIYTYMTDDQINSIADGTRRRTFQTKKKYQIHTYNYCKGLYTEMYGSEKEMQNIIRSGIISSFKCTPEELAQSIAEGTKGVGVLGIDDIIAIITAVGSIIIAVVTAICECVLKSNQAKFKAMDNSIISSSAPSESDYDGLSLSSGTTGSKKPLLYLALAGIAAMFLLKK